MEFYSLKNQRFKVVIILVCSIYRLKKKCFVQMNCLQPLNIHRVSVDIFIPELQKYFKEFMNSY